MRRSVFFIIISILLFCCKAEKVENIDENTPVPEKRIREADFEYMGAFRLPAGISETSTWDWGGTAMACYPSGDPGGTGDGYPGSIFGAGHAWEHRVSEISIPAPVVSIGKDLSILNRASTLQQFTDVLDSGGLEIPRTGIGFFSDSSDKKSGVIYFCRGEHMQEGEKSPSHGFFGTDLSNPKKKGLWKVDDLTNYVTSDYIFEIPKNWADKYVGGKFIATGRFRDGGQGAMGPSLIAVSPVNTDSPPGAGSVLEAKPLLLYQNVYVNDPEKMDNYHHSDEWSGGVWITKDDRAAVLFIGTKGIGNCWYGFSNGVRWEEPYPPVPDYPHDDRGWWSTEFRAMFIFYDPAELAEVAEGKKKSFEPQPFMKIDVGKYLFNDDFKNYETGHGIERVQRKYRLGACSFDRERSLLYVFELFADGDRPLVHCWKVN